MSTTKKTPTYLWRRDLPGGFTAEWTDDPEATSDDRVLARYTLRCSILDAAGSEVIAIGRIHINDLRHPQLEQMEVAMTELAKDAEKRRQPRTRFERI